MEYNTARELMQIPEYGRNIQKMIEYAKTIEDKDERNRAAKSIIKVMGQVNPYLKNNEDLTHKLWDHMFIIADFEFDVDDILNTINEISKSKVDNILSQTDEDPATNPNYKFDLRIYALLTNMNPLELFIYNEGKFLKRICEIIK